MTSALLCTVVGLATLAATTPARADAPRTEAWEDFHPDIPAAAVQRISDRYPLSDQHDAGGWTPYAPMTDEFNGASLDAGKWWDHNPSWAGRKPSWFSPSNVTVSQDALHLTMRAEEPPAPARAEGYHTFTSAAVQSKETVLYGYFEVRARPMRSHGSSAFWFYKTDPRQWTEIDVFEIGGGAPGFERKLFETVHVFRTPTVKKHLQIGSHWLAPYDLADGWHVYGLEWDARQIKYYFDGVLVREGPNTYWHQALTMNFDSETMPDWFGLPTPAELPSTFSIDYVRAWKKRRP